MDSKAIGINIGVVDEQFYRVGKAVNYPAYLLLLDIDLRRIRNKNNGGIFFINRIALFFIVYGRA